MEYYTMSLTLAIRVITSMAADDEWVLRDLEPFLFSQDMVPIHSNPPDA